MIHFIDLFAGIGGIRLGVSNALKAHGIYMKLAKSPLLISCWEVSHVSLSLTQVSAWALAIHEALCFLR